MSWKMMKQTNFSESFREAGRGPGNIIYLEADSDYSFTVIFFISAFLSCVDRLPLDSSKAQLILCVTTCCCLLCGRAADILLICSRLFIWSIIGQSHTHTLTNANSFTHLGNSKFPVHLTSMCLDCGSLLRFGVTPGGQCPHSVSPLSTTSDGDKTECVPAWRRTATAERHRSFYTLTPLLPAPTSTPSHSCACVSAASRRTSL